MEVCRESDLRTDMLNSSSSKVPPNASPTGQFPLSTFDMFDQCVVQCDAAWEDIETIGGPQPGPTLGTTTFKWKDDDIPLEDGTYMQCEEPWQADRSMTGVRSNNFGP